jgi:hypothetical protein
VERDVQKLGGGFSVFEALGDDAKGESLNARHGFIAIGSVAQNASKAWYFRQPPPVTLAFKLDRKRHAGTVTSGPAISQPHRGWVAFGRAVETLDDFANGVPQQLRSLRLGDHTFCQRANAQAFETGWPFVRQRVRLAPPPFLDAKDLEHTGEGRLTDDAQVLAAIRDRLRPLGLAVGLIDVLSRDSDTTA